MTLLKGTYQTFALRETCLSNSERREKVVKLILPKVGGQFLFSQVNSSGFEWLSNVPRTWAKVICSIRKMDTLGMCFQICISTYSEAFHNHWTLTQSGIDCLSQPNCYQLAQDLPF